MIHTVYPIFYYTLLIIVILLCVLYWYQTKHFAYWKTLGVPFCPPHWLFGNCEMLIFQRDTMNNISKEAYKMFKANGFWGGFLFRKPVLNICHPELIEKVLMQDFELFHDRWDTSFDDEPLLQSLFLATGDKWRNMRVKLGQSFSPKKVQNMFDQIVKCSDLVMSEICDGVNKKQPLQMEPLAFSFAAEAIASCAFGVQLFTDPAQGKQFRDVMDMLLRLTPLKIVTFFFKLINPTIGKWLKIKFTDKEVETYFLQLCRDAIEHRKQNQIERNDFLQLMITLKEQESNITHAANLEIASGNRLFSLVMNWITVPSLGKQMFNDYVIASFIMNFFQAGVKPAEVTLSFALFEIASNPDIQKVIHDEINLTVAKHKGWTYEAVKDMTYLDQVIQETLRLHSYNSNLVRTVTQPFTIPNTSITLEKGMQVYIPAAAIHMDPQYYPSPEVFNPDRFKGNNYKSSSCYMPFGAGPRICVSIRLAVTMMKVYLARLLAEYSVRIDEENMQLPLKFDPKVFFPKAVGGIFLTLENR